jgi:predicted O-methyltransferase YrrM
MDFLDKSIEDYAGHFTSPESKLMQDLNRETHLKKLQPRMLSGHLQGAFLSMISKLKQATNILEIGTYTGYSALALATGLSDNGKLVTIEFNEEHEKIANEYFKRAGLENKIELIIGDAGIIIPSLDYKWDIVFIDADKISYSRYFDLVIDSLLPGGLIIADNVLWSGKVLKKNIDLDEDTKAIKAFNQKILDDERVENMLLPFRDGLSLIRKK